MSTFVKGGGGAGEKVKIDGVKVANKMELTSYKGANPLTIGQAGVAFPANTLFLEDFDILNGVNGEDLTDTAADQTTAVSELMKMVSRKIAMNNGEGQYVWKKYEEVTGTITITQITSATAVPAVLQLASDDINLSNIDFNELAGLTSVYHPSSGTPQWVLEFVSDSKVKLDGNTYSMTWDSEKAQMSINANFGYVNTYAPVTATVKEYQCLVVSADESDYPNGGMQDGYWYELVEEGIDLLAITGCTKMAVNKFTFSTRTEIKSAGTIKHSLGETPKMVMLLSSMLNRQDSNYIFAFYMPISGYSYNLTGARSSQYQGSYSVSVENLSANADGIFKTSTGGYFEAGVEYTLITIA